MVVVVVMVCICCSVCVSARRGGDGGVHARCFTCFSPFPANGFGMSDLANAPSRPSTSVTLHTIRKTPSREDNSSRTRACNSVKSSSAASQFSLPVLVW